MIKKKGSADKYAKDEVTKHYCNWLKQMRQEKKFTIRGLAAILDVPHSFVSKVENQERRLDVTEYIRYCEALGVCPNDGITYALSNVAK